MIAQVNCLLGIVLMAEPSWANEGARRLYETLMHKRDYNKLVRPVHNNSDKLDVLLSLKLTQLIDIVSTQWNELVTFCLK